MNLSDYKHYSHIVFLILGERNIYFFIVDVLHEKDEDGGFATGGWKRLILVLLYHMWFVCTCFEL